LAGDEGGSRGTLNDSRLALRSMSKIWRQPLESMNSAMTLSPARAMVKVLLLINHAVAVSPTADCVAFNYAVK
jgi:hypothetical protein